MKTETQLPPLPLSDDQILEALREHHRNCVTGWEDVHRVIVSPDGTISHWSGAVGSWHTVCAGCRRDPCECEGIPFDFLLMQSDGCHANDWNESFVPVTWRDAELNHVSPTTDDDQQCEWYFALPKRETATFQEVVDWYVDDHMEEVDLEKIKRRMRKCFLDQRMTLARFRATPS